MILFLEKGRFQSLEDFEYFREIFLELKQEKFLLVDFVRNCFVFSGYFLLDFFIRYISFILMEVLMIDEVFNKVFQYLLYVK